MAAEGFGREAQPATDGDGDGDGAGGGKQTK